MGTFEENRYYEPDPDVQARMTLVYSADEELSWNRHDTMALTAMHLQQFTKLPVVTYEAVLASSRESMSLCCVIRGGTGPTRPLPRMVRR